MLSEQERVRRASLAELEGLGINAYPSATFGDTTNAKHVHEQFDALVGKRVRLAGRIMSKRIMGSAAFAELQDASGKIQIYLRRDDLCPGDDKTLYNTVFKKHIDLGDFVGVEGTVFSTQTGEHSVHLDQFTLLAKALRPLPVVKSAENEQGVAVTYDAFADAELRYRQRYVDLVVNTEVRQVFVQRSRMQQSMRNFLIEKGYLEVETPILQPIYGGASARPFKTHHNTLDMTLYLRIANELYLKRLIVGGYDGVFEFAKDFRNEGMSRFHNPEFTMMELYVAYKDYTWMMDLMEEMIERICLDLHGTTVARVGEHEINFARPWARMTMYDAISGKVGQDVSNADEAELRALCAKNGVAADDSFGRGKLIDALFGDLVEPYLIQPTFITDYPVEMSPLAKDHRDKPGIVERFEAIVNGKELCNGFSELNNPLEQRRRFEAQLELGRRGDTEAMVLDEDFLRALEYGMPPTAGVGIGMDRLAMIMTDSRSIQDVLFFPQMKPEVQEGANNALDFGSLGIPAHWHAALEALAFATPDEFKASKPSRILNELGSYRKRHKLEVPPPTMDEIAIWQAS